MKNMSIPAVEATPAQVTNNRGQNLSGCQIWLHIRIIRGKTTEAKKNICMYIYFRLQGGRAERLLSSPHLTGIPKLQLAAQLVQSVVKNLPANGGETRDVGWIPGLEDPLEKEVAIHSSILAWEIPWTEEPGGHNPWGHKESDTTEHVCTHTPRTTMDQRD